LIGFLDRTFSSNSLLESVKKRRAKICEDALDPTAFPYILDSVVSEYQYGPVRSVEIAQFARRFNDVTNEATYGLVKAIVSSVVATAQLRNDYWFTVASGELGVAESVLRNYATHDLSLAILIHVTCQQFTYFEKSSWPSDTFSKVLRAASKFDVQQSSPELQHRFCALWNRIVLPAQGGGDHDGRKIARFILSPIYKVYIDIHQGIAAPRTRLFARAGDFAVIPRNIFQYPVCRHEDHDTSYFIPDDHGGTEMTFARLVGLVHLTSETFTPSHAFVTTAPGASPAMTFTPDPGAAEGDVNRANLANALDPQSSSLPSITDSIGATADRSREPNAGRVGGDRPPHVSHCWYDVV